ncbi:MAG TPA: SpaA isopeptide-forming pilin-related protein [Acidimicrobiales bacterium]|nr:SpaA isopeptide-forming pilin-related protein [Acidimicrobiales bacterium]
MTKTNRLVLGSLLLASGSALGLYASSLVVSAATGSTLSGSTFESGDGDLIAATSGGTNDWVAASGTNHTSPAPSFVGKQDKPSGSSDDAFGQGSKEDIACPTVVSGSIPPNKSDLTRFYVAHEFGSNNDVLLYLAWERANVLGNANMDFEFDQNRAADAPCANGVTPMRKAGDLLITFDFGGSGQPDIGRLFWLTAAAGNTASQCFASSSLPCWGKRVDLSAAGEANGAVNTTTLSDPLTFTGSTPGPVSLPAGTFGEAGIDLTTALSGSGTSSGCNTFGSADLNSRSSSSFTSEIKDFIAPATVSVSNCVEVNAYKYDSTNNNPLAGATFTLTNTDTSATVGTCTTDSTGYCTHDFGGVAFGNYKLCETTAPVGYNADSSCQSFTVGPGTTSPVILRFSDTPKPESVVLTKEDDTGAPLGGAVFTIYTNSSGAPGTATTYTCTSQAVDGSCTIDNIALAGGDYWLVETTTPSGYGTATSAEIVLTPGDKTTTDINGNPLTFQDPRLFKIITLVCNEATGSLIGGSVSYDGGTSATSATTLPSGDTGASICTITGGGVDPDVHAGPHASSINIS